MSHQQSFVKSWLDTVDLKNSQLCVGLDPAMPGERDQLTVPQGQSKLDYCLKVIEAVAPYTAAIKPNRQYLRDLSLEEMQRLVTEIHNHGMLAIDDSKIADIGSTNDAAFANSALEGYDAITYAPFAGNVEQAVASCNRQKLALITLVLMSNPEFTLLKQARSEGGESLNHVIARKVASSGGGGIVVGAPSPSNHIAPQELESINQLCPDQLVLVPGIGAQGGEAEPILRTFGKRAMINVTRGVFYASDPAAEARKYQQQLQLES